MSQLCRSSERGLLLRKVEYSHGGVEGQVESFEEDFAIF